MIANDLYMNNSRICNNLNNLFIFYEHHITDLALPLKELCQMHLSIFGGLDNLFLL